MKMKRNYWFAVVLGLLMTVNLTSCDDDDPVLTDDENTGLQDEEQDSDDTEATETVSGYYVLSSGRMGSNNATLAYYNRVTGEIEDDVFLNRNGRSLGDTANDMIIYGEKMYIAMYGSQTVEVTDLQGNSLKQIQSESGSPLQPRHMTSYDGKVYITLYDGYVARLDTASLEIEQVISVGRNPEQLAVANNKLYVANSGGLDYNTEVGYDNTVSVIDLGSFSETNKLEVVINPCNMAVDSEGDVYLVSMGNYGDVPNTLQKIDSSTDEVSVVTETNATEIASLGDELFILYSQYDADWNQEIFFIRYDAINESVITDEWLGEPVAQPYKIGADATEGTLFVTESDYTNNGDVYCFNTNGTLGISFEAGLNPVKVLPVEWEE